MIVVMQSGSSKEQLEHVVELVEQMGKRARESSRHVDAAAVARQFHEAFFPDCASYAQL